MHQSRFTDTQINSIRKEANAGENSEHPCGERGVFDAPCFNRRSTYGGMEAPNLSRVQDLEIELSQSKCMYAELSLGKDAMQILINKRYEAVGDARVGGVFGQ